MLVFIKKMKQNCFKGHLISSFEDVFIAVPTLFKELVVTSLMWRSSECWNRIAAKW